MISYPCTLLSYRGFYTDFIFIVILYRYQNVFKSVPATIVSLFWKTILMPYHWPSCSVLRIMSIVRNREIRNVVLLGTFDLLLTCFCFGILYKYGMFDDRKKTTVLFICIHKRVKSIVFAVSIKILRWNRSSDFKCRLFKVYRLWHYVKLYCKI